MSEASAWLEKISHGCQIKTDGRRGSYRIMRISKRPQPSGGNWPSELQSDQCAKLKVAARAGRCARLQTWLTGHSVLRSKIVRFVKRVLLNLYNQTNQGWRNRAGGNCPIKVLVSRSEPVLKTISHWLRKEMKTRPQWEHLKNIRGVWRTLWCSRELHKQKCQLLGPCLTLCDPMDCSQSSSSVHGILYASILE